MHWVQALAGRVMALDMRAQIGNDLSMNPRKSGQGLRPAGPEEGAAEGVGVCPSIVILGDTIQGYYFPDGFFIPQNRVGDPGGAGRWFFLSVGVLLGAGLLAFAVARTAGVYRGRRWP